MSRVCAALLFVAFGSSTVTLRAGDDSLLDVIRAGYAQRQASIKSIQAKYELEGVLLESQSRSGAPEIVEWLSDGSNWRYRRNVTLVGRPAPVGTRNPLDVVVRDGVSTSLRISAKPTGEIDSQATIANDSHLPISFSDLRSRCLDYVRDSPLLTVADALIDQAGIKSCRSADDGRLIVEYEVEPGHSSRIQFAPDRNFMVERITATYSENPRFASIDEEVIECSEVKPGIWFPTTIDHRQVRRSEKGDLIRPVAANRLRITELKVNEPLPEDAFVIDFPRGTEIANEIKGTLYFWGDGAPDGPEMPLPVLAAPPTMLIDEPLPETGRSWLMAINLLILGTIACALLLRKKKSRATGTGAPLNESF